MDLLNKVMVVGNLTRDPEVRETGNGKMLANLSLAIDPPGGAGKSREQGGTATAEPIFLDVVVWERMAENASQYLKKGSAVLIEGRLQMDSWQDKQSGQARSKLKVVGERMRFVNLGSGRDDANSARGGGRRRPAAMAE